MLFVHLSGFKYTHEYQQGANGVSLYILVTCLPCNSIATDSLWKTDYSKLVNTQKNRLLFGIKEYRNEANTLLL